MTKTMNSPARVHSLRVALRALLSPQPDVARTIAMAPAIRGVAPIGFPATPEETTTATSQQAKARPRPLPSPAPAATELRSVAPAVAHAERHVA